MNDQLLKELFREIVKDMISDEEGPLTERQQGYNQAREEVAHLVFSKMDNPRGYVLEVVKEALTEALFGEEDDHE